MKRLREIARDPQRPGIVAAVRSKEALDRNHVRYQEYMYPNVNHGFHNDTTPRYDEKAAKLAWSRTLAFFDEHLKH